VYLLAVEFQLYQQPTTDEKVKLKQDEIAFVGMRQVLRSQQNSLETYEFVAWHLETKNKSEKLEQIEHNEEHRTCQLPFGNR
jgi:hypothetical protein